MTPFPADHRSVYSRTRMLSDLPMMPDQKHAINRDPIHELYSELARYPENVRYGKKKQTVQDPTQGYVLNCRVSLVSVKQEHPPVSTSPDPIRLKSRGQLLCKTALGLGLSDGSS